LGVSVSLGEHEVHWRTFLQSLVERGMRGVELIISDDHLGLKAARKAVFGGVPWQRCQFHLQQNAQAYVPRQSMKAEVAEDLRRIFNTPNRSMSEMYLSDTIQKYEKAAPRLANWMEHNVPEGLTVFSFPPKHQRRIWTTNMLERLRHPSGISCSIGIDFLIVVFFLFLYSPIKSSPFRREPFTRVSFVIEPHNFMYDVKTAYQKKSV